VNGRILLALGAVGWVGTSLLLQQVRWVSRPSLTDRLRPYLAGAGPTGRGTTGLRGEVLLWAAELSAWVSGLTGGGDDVARRLARIHAAEEPSTFRTRQVGWAIAGMAAAGAVSGVLAFPAPVVVVFLLGGPILGFLVPEHQLIRRSEAWQERVFLELPVIAEQLALLLGAGWSLGSALHRLAVRGSGAVSLDLERVCRRIRQGVREEEALREWASLSGVPAVERLVAVLVMNRATSDLGRLVAEEARQIRREDHRRLVVQVERRNQQVWIPVTVAALVPGVLFLAIPFVDALRAFGG
jgi:tight adherence protein C